MKPKIVFHGLRKTLEESEGLKILGGMSEGEVLGVLLSFERRESKMLNVPIQMNGWRTTLWADEVDIEFVGCDGGHYKELRDQAMNRTRPVFLREHSVK